MNKGRNVAWALWNLIRESDYSRTGILPDNRALNHSLRWWLKFGSDVRQGAEFDAETEAALRAETPMREDGDEVFIKGYDQGWRHGQAEKEAAWVAGQTRAETPAPLYRRVDQSIVPANGKDWPPILRDGRCNVAFLDKIVAALNGQTRAETPAPDLECPYCGYPRSQHSPVEAICPVQPQTALEGGTIEDKSDL